MPNNKERILVEEGPPSKRFRVTLSVYHGTPQLALRFWYTDKESGEFKAGKHGINLTRKHYEAAREAFVDNSEEIMDYLGVGYVPGAVKSHQDVQGRAAEAARLRGGPFTVGHESEGNRFFRVSHEGGIEKIIFNENHPLSKRLERLGATGCGTDDLEQVLGALLSAYTRAKSSMRDTVNGNVTLLFDQLEHNWSEILATTVPQED